MQSWWSLEEMGNPDTWQHEDSTPKSLAPKYEERKVSRGKLAASWAGNGKETSSVEGLQSECAMTTP